jgi:hypothetical protein
MPGGNMTKKTTTPRIAALAALLTLSIGALEATANELRPSGVCTDNFSFLNVVPSKVDAPFLEMLRSKSKAKIVRHIREGEAYTKDYRNDRLNVFSGVFNHVVGGEGDYYISHKCF